MTWWMWLAGGLVLMVAELATPSGFYMLFFGVGAFGVALPPSGSGRGVDEGKEGISRRLGCEGIRPPWTVAAPSRGARPG